MKDRIFRHHEVNRKLICQIFDFLILHYETFRITDMVPLFRSIMEVIKEVVKFMSRCKSFMAE